MSYLRVSLSARKAVRAAYSPWNRLLNRLLVSRSFKLGKSARLELCSCSGSSEICSASKFSRMGSSPSDCSRSSCL